MNKRIPYVVIRRLPRYYRHLGDLIKQGVERVSSVDLSGKMKGSASQIRQDLNFFGGFGQQGYGYNAEHLRKAIGEILGLNNERTMIVVGAGNLGMAVAKYQGFAKYNFKVVGIFDSDLQKIGGMVGNLVVRDIDELENEFNALKPAIAIICVPSSAAKGIAQRLCDLGIKGIWNFSPADLTGFADVCTIENVHFSDSLMSLAFAMENKKDD